MYRYCIPVLDPQVITDHTIHPGTTIVQGFIRKDYENSFLPLLPLDNDCIASEQSECVHGGLRESDN